MSLLAQHLAWAVRDLSLASALAPGSPALEPLEHRCRVIAAALLDTRFYFRLEHE